MNYCQFRNDAIKRMAVTSEAPILPPEYQQVEYIQTTGTQYINTGISSTTAIASYNCKAAITAYNSSNYLFGVWDYSGRCFVAYTSSTITLGYATGYNDVTYTLSANTPYTFSGTLKPGSQTLHIDGSLINSQSISSTPTPARNIYLGAANSLGAANQFIKAKIYNYTLETASGTIINLIPCYRKADNKPGMYDLVTNTFFTNAGSGEFTVGNDVV